eukprot:588117-Rhodomonas_salina.1
MPVVYFRWYAALHLGVPGVINAPTWLGLTCDILRLIIYIMHGTHMPDAAHRELQHGRGTTRLGRYASATRCAARWAKLVVGDEAGVAHYGPPTAPVSYTHLTLPTICSV